MNMVLFYLFYDLCLPLGIKVEMTRNAEQVQ